jgi:hypothetical protein
MIEDKFTKWIKWQDRKSLDGLNFPGVYSIAISETDLTNKDFKLTNEIKYFGMTNSKAGLKGRLTQFDNTIKGKTGHGGADRFRFRYQNYDDLVAKLFVSVSIFKCNVESNTPKDLLVMGDIVRFEFVCFADYAEKFNNNLPVFNDKKNAPKYSSTFKQRGQ